MGQRNDERAAELIGRLVAGETAAQLVADLEIDGRLDVGRLADAVDIVLQGRQDDPTASVHNLAARAGVHTTRVKMILEAAGEPVRAQRPPRLKVAELRRRAVGPLLDGVDAAKLAAQIEADVALKVDVDEVRQLADDVAAVAAVADDGLTVRQMVQQAGTTQDVAMLVTHHLGTNRPPGRPPFRHHFDEAVRRLAGGQGPDEVADALGVSGDWVRRLAELADGLEPLVEAELTVQQIARRLAVAESTVTALRDAFGLGTPPPGRRPDPLRPQVVELAGEGLTAAQIGQRLGKHPAWVRTVVRQAGVDLADGRAAHGARRRKVDPAQVLTMVAAGHSQPHVARTLGVSAQTVSRIVRAAADADA